MPLPNKPERSAPIPNDPFDSPEVTTIRGPYWDMPIGENLELSPQGDLKISGLQSSESYFSLYGTQGLIGIGNGILINAEGELEQRCDNPPFGCQTNVNPYCVSNFTDAWRGCTGLVNFPKINLSSGTNFTDCWRSCSSLVSFPDADLSNGVNFTRSWYFCTNLVSFLPQDLSNGVNFFGTWGFTKFTTFPVVDVSNGVEFGYAWEQMPNLIVFPSLNFTNGTQFLRSWWYSPNLVSVSPVSFPKATLMTGAWEGCSKLANFPAGAFDDSPCTNYTSAFRYCALTQQSVDNILVSINNAGTSNGVLGIQQGTSSSPGASGLAAKAALVSRGWTVVTN